MNDKKLKDIEDSSKRIRRTNAEIKKSIFDAVYQIIKEKGFSVLSINLISEYSTVSPIIINKRFKDLDDIVDQFINRWEYWIDIFSDDSGKEGSKETYQNTIESVLDIVWKKKAIQQILAWEMVEDSPLLDSAVRDRELKINKMVSRYTRLFENSGYDVRLLSAILLSAIYYLSGYKKKESFCGLNFKGNIGNLKLLEGTNQIIDLVFDNIEKTKEKEIAKKLIESGDSVEKVMSITGLSQDEIVNL